MLDRDLGQLLADLQRIGIEVLLREAAREHLAVDVVDRHDGRQDEVENKEVALEAVRNVIFAAPRVLHGCNVLQVNAFLEVAA